MKKFICFLLAATALFAVGACSNDEAGGGRAAKAIVVDSANVLFSDAPGTGKVVVTAANGITKVESSNDWCQATINGNTVVVTVTQNLSRIGRAAQLTIWSGNDSQQITIQQLGLSGIFFSGQEDNLVAYKDTVLTFPLVSPAGYPISGTSTASWMSTTIEKGILKIAVTANTSSNYRTGKLIFTSGPRNDKMEVTVSQGWNMASKVDGAWKLYYYSTADTTGRQPRVWNVTLKNDSMHVAFGSRGNIIIPIKADLLYAKFSIQATVRCGGTYQGYTPFLFFGTPDNKSWSGYNRTTSLAEGRVMADGQGNLRVHFAGNVYDERYEFASFLFYFHDGVPSGLPTSNKTLKSSFNPMFYPYLVKEGAVTP